MRRGNNKTKQTNLDLVLLSVCVMAGQDATFFRYARNVAGVPSGYARNVAGVSSGYARNVAGVPNSSFSSHPSAALEADDSDVLRNLDS